MSLPLFISLLTKLITIKGGRPETLSSLDVRLLGPGQVYEQSPLFLLIAVLGGPSDSRLEAPALQASSV